MKTDCSEKVIVFNDHVGINKQISDVDALLDIDNVSNSMMLSILQKFKPLSNNSYDCSSPLKSMIQEFLRKCAEDSFLTIDPNTQLPSVFDNSVHLSLLQTNGLKLRTLITQEPTLKSFIENIIVFAFLYRTLLNLMM